MEVLRGTPAHLTSLVPSCTCFRTLPRHRNVVNFLPSLTRSHCIAWNHHTRREVLSSGVAVLGASMLNARASAATEMPQMPKVELAEGLSISQVVYASYYELNNRCYINVDQA